MTRPGEARRCSRRYSSQMGTSSRGAENAHLAEYPGGRSTCAKWGGTSASAPEAVSATATALNGDAWDFFPHDNARSRAYRWNEDGLAGICDGRQGLCFSLARSGMAPTSSSRSASTA